MKHCIKILHKVKKSSTISDINLRPKYFFSNYPERRFEVITHIFTPINIKMTTPTSSVAKTGRKD